MKTNPCVLLTCLAPLLCTAHELPEPIIPQGVGVNIQYTAMALAASKAIRAADPHATLIGPATSTFPWEFLETFFKSGILEYLDGVSVHPYREPQRAPETATADYERLRSLIERYAPADKKRTIRILSGEWGYSTWERGVSPDTQAAFLVRQQLNNLLNEVPLSIWYDWKNDGEDPKENEHNFGTVTPDLQPKPAYTAVKTLTHELAGYRIAQRQTLDSDRDFLLVCTNTAGGQKLVAWTLGEAHDIKVNVPPSRTVSGKSISGEKIELKVTDDKCGVSLSPGPIFLTLNPAEPK